MSQVAPAVSMTPGAPNFVPLPETPVTLGPASMSQQQQEMMRLFAQMQSMAASMGLQGAGSPARRTRRGLRRHLLAARAGGPYPHGSVNGCSRAAAARREPDSSTRRSEALFWYVPAS